MLYFDFVSRDPRSFDRSCQQFVDLLLTDTSAYLGWLAAFGETANAEDTSWGNLAITALLQLGPREAVAQGVVSADQLQILAVRPALLNMLESRLAREAAPENWRLSLPGILAAQSLARAVLEGLRNGASIVVLDTGTGQRCPVVAGRVHVPLVDDCVLTLHVERACVGRLHVQPSSKAVRVRFATGAFRGAPAPSELHFRAAAAPDTESVDRHSGLISYTASSSRLTMNFLMSPEA